MTILPWYTGIILALAEFFGMHHIVTRVLLNQALYTDGLSQTPYFSGIIAGTIVWVLYCWITRFVPHTQNHSLLNFLFAISVGLCIYNFFRAIMLDPGTCPKPTSDAELKSIIEELASEGRLNGQTFCIQCMGRKPLRSKHCRVCDKCIARSDHHCPWVWNCVGVNNHLDPSQISTSCPLPADLCAITTKDTFLVSVAFWVTLQLLWTFILLVTQLWQVARQMTTLEVSNLGRYGYMGGRGASLSNQLGHRHHRHSANSLPGVDSEDSSLVGSDTPNPDHRHAGPCAGCGSGFLMNLLGLDRFTKGKAVDGLARASKASNPFDIGIATNCKDFWTAGRELGVEYEALYDVPIEGFKEAKIRRERDEMDEGLSSSRKPRKSLFMGLGLGFGGNSRSGYEPVSQA
ncbi:hypothetical protein M378DRAFT_579742 [Amanita muscaria Koide BX008]|uniref:Palmitoyltransferase n=1 Tax=Amanita muscaria (strain Koide BX008) TaxID=946122 RepID=A0A0C2WSD9_AMAMK|nr:hypothetical protein M378DRAFT_579742 [Amanita muscaria Koide BX008]